MWWAPSRRSRPLAGVGRGVRRRGAVGGGRTAPVGRGDVQDRRRRRPTVGEPLTARFGPDLTSSSDTHSQRHIRYVLVVSYTRRSRVTASTATVRSRSSPRWSLVLVVLVVQRPRRLPRGSSSRPPWWQGAIGVRDAVDLSDKAARLVDQGPPGVSANVGVGVWVTIAGAALALVGGIMALAMSSRGSSPRATLRSGRRRDLVESVLRPVFGVRFGVLAHHRAVDRVDLHETAHRRRLVGAVQQDAPHRARAQAVPRELRAGVPDREPDRARRDEQRLGLVDVRAATR